MSSPHYMPKSEGVEEVNLSAISDTMPLDPALSSSASKPDPTSSATSPLPRDQAPKIRTARRMPPIALPSFIGLESGRPAAVLYPPHAALSPPLPLVVVLHAWGSNASEHAAYLGVSERLSRFQFIALLPNGIKNSKGYRFWNAPACCNREGIAVDDLGYLTDLLQEARDRLPVDPARVYLTGHSNGGQMALYLACRSGGEGHIRGLVSIAGFGPPPACPAPRPCSALFIHGTDDAVVPFDTSLQAFDKWVEGEGCLAESPLSTPPAASLPSSAIGASSPPTPTASSQPYCRLSKPSDPSSMLNPSEFPAPILPFSSPHSPASTCSQFTRDLDCDPSFAVGAKDPRLSSYRDANCALRGEETVVTQYVGCGGEKGANVSFWRMEGASHVPAFSPDSLDAMLSFLLDM